MIDSKNGKNTLDETAAQGYVMTFMQKRQAEMMKEQFGKNIDEGEKFLADNKKRDGIQETASGLQYEVITMGTGPKPAAEEVVKVHYTGTLTDGTKFDSSVDRRRTCSVWCQPGHQGMAGRHTAHAGRVKIQILYSLRAWIR